MPLQSAHLCGARCSLVTRYNDFDARHARYMHRGTSSTRSRKSVCWLMRGPNGSRNLTLGPSGSGNLRNQHRPCEAVSRWAPLLPLRCSAALWFPLIALSALHRALPTRSWITGRPRDHAAILAMHKLRRDSRRGRLAVQGSIRPPPTTPFHSAVNHRMVYVFMATR